MAEQFVKIDYKKTVRWFSDAERRQVPFAAATTLTRLAQGSQTRLRRTLRRYFTIRSEHRIKAGIRIKPARKSDFKRGTMHSDVFDVDQFMALHVTGGMKRPAKHRYVSIPRKQLLRQGVRTATGKIKRRWKPGTLIGRIKGQKSNPRKRKWGRHRKPRPFVLDIAGLPLIAVRTGKGRFPLKYLWGMQSQARIDRRWPYFEIAAAFAAKNFPGIFASELKRALRTAR